MFSVSVIIPTFNEAENILKVINPILPHFSNECLQRLKQKVSEIRWPKVNKKYLEDEVVNIVTQVNGRKRKVFHCYRIFLLI